MIGGYDLELFAKPGEVIEWTNLVQSHYWSLSLNACILESEDGEE